MTDDGCVWVGMHHRAGEKKNRQAGTGDEQRKTSVNDVSERSLVGAEPRSAPSKAPTVIDKVRRSRRCGHGN